MRSNICRRSEHAQTPAEMSALVTEATARITGKLAPSLGLQTLANHSSGAFRVAWNLANPAMKLPAKVTGAMKAVRAKRTRRASARLAELLELLK